MAEETKKKKPMWKKILMGIGCMFVLLVIAGMMSGSKNETTQVSAPQENNTVEQQTAAPTVDSDTQKPDFDMTPADLIKSYKKNEVAADNKYKGKLIRLTGKVGEVKKDIMDSLYVTFKNADQYQFESVQCMFEDEHNDELSSLEKGQKIIIQGIGDGLMGNVLIKDCEIIKK